MSPVRPQVTEVAPKPDRRLLVNLRLSHSSGVGPDFRVTNVRF